MNLYVVGSSLTLLALNILASTAFGAANLCQPFEIRAQNIPGLLKKIEQRSDVNTRMGEQIAKQNIIKLHQKNPTEFFKRFSQATNGDQYQSYLEEVQTALTESGKLFGRAKPVSTDFMKTANITRAKNLARYILFVTASDNWNQVGKTIVNDGASESLDEFQKALSIKLKDNLVFMQKKNPNNKDTYLFLLPENDGVRVTLRKNEINKGEVCLGSASKHENNQLIPEASKIFMDPAAVAAAKERSKKEGSAKTDSSPEPFGSPSQMQVNSGAPARPGGLPTTGNNFPQPNPPYGNSPGSQQPFHDPFDDFDPDF